MKTTINKLLTRLQWGPGHLWNVVVGGMLGWRRYDEVSPHLYLGGIPTLDELDTVAATGVTRVINLCEEFTWDAEQLASRGLTGLHLPTLDRVPPTEADLRAGLAFIAEGMARGERTYVHCRAGKGRGATLALCHLVVHEGLDPAAAYERLKDTRPQISAKLDRREAVQAIAQAPAVT